MLVQWYGANPNNQQVVNYLIGSQRSCGTRSIARNPLVCCSRPVSYQLPSQTQAPVPPPTQPPAPTTPEAPPTLPSDGSEPWASRPNPQVTKPVRFTTQPTTAPVVTQPPPTAAPTRSGNDCNDPKGVPGVCKGIRDCPHIKTEFVDRQNDKSYIEYIRKSNVICKGASAVICCTDLSRATDGTNNNNNAGVRPRLLTPEEGCGFSNATHTRVVGGQPAKKGAYPWMALVGYTDNFGKLGWKCGGSLITTR